MDPTGQGDHLPEACGAQFVAMMRAFHFKIRSRASCERGKSEFGFQRETPKNSA